MNHSIKIVAIHQPNFFPWLGFFDKIWISDKFVLLDDVQFIKKGGNWGNRMMLLIETKKKWVTVPIHRSYHGYKLINEIEINNEIPWKRKFFGQLDSYYKKCNFFDETILWLKEMLDKNEQKLADFNTKVITSLVRKLSIGEEKLVLSSKLLTQGKATDRLISIVNAVQGNCYLCGGGADGYQEDEKFKQTGITLRYQNFEHPKYYREDSLFFTPGLSIVDCLMNIGVEGVEKLLKGDI